MCDIFEFDCINETQELCTLEIIILNAILFHQILALLILIQEPM